MARKKGSDGGLIYSTDRGRICPSCGHPAGNCRCSRGAARSAGDGIARVSRQTKGRKGSGVSLVSGLELEDKELRELAGRLKKKCGSGGTVKEGVIEIQGDKRNLLVDELTRMGYTVKLAGG